MQIEVRKPTLEEMEIAKNWPVWSKEISQFSWSYGEKETCLILKGKARVIADDGEIAEFQAGDWVIFSSGLNCTWEILEEIEKRYNFG